MESQRPSKGFPPEAVADARSIVGLLLYVLKMFSLYAEDHTNCQTAIIRLHNDLSTYLSKYKELPITVEKSQLLFGNEVVHEGAAKDGDLAFALFRDGILKLSFHKGIDSRETKVFVRILHDYKVLPAEAEGDIVTALWEAQLPHVQYMAADNIIETDSDGGISTSKEKRQGAVRSTKWDSLEIFESLEALKRDAPSLQIADRIKELRRIDTSIFELSKPEIKALQKMVRQEEERDATGEILNMMADILKDQQDQEFFDVVLEFLEEELQTSLVRKNFDISLRILKRLHQIHKLSEKSRSWALSRIKEFFLRASDGDFLATLQDLWPTMSASQLEKAKRVLILLPPTAIGALGAMLFETRAPSVRNMLSDVIVILAARDLRPFETLLKTAQEDLVHRLVPLLGRMKDKRSAQILVKMAQHPAERVRMEALKAVMARDLWIPDKLVSLMEDESSFIRDLYLDYLGSRRSKATESLLLDYLGKRRFRGMDNAHLSACFRALGKCGTARSIPFLQDTLLRGGLISRFRASARRQGAAIALVELGTERAKQVLVQAAQSRFPGIRNAAQAVL